MVHSCVLGSVGPKGADRLINDILKENRVYISLYSIQIVFAINVNRKHWSNSGSWTNLVHSCVLKGKKKTDLQRKNGLNFFFFFFF